MGGNKFYEDQAINIIASTISNTEYTARWNRIEIRPGDQTVSLRNNSDPEQGMMYRGDSNDGTGHAALENNGGMNVYKRNSTTREFFSH